MEGVLGYTKVSTFTKIIPQIHCNFYKIRKMKLRVSANLSNGDDPLLQAAINAATLRFHETLREKPLFHDPYVACFVSPSTSINDNQSAHPYCLATRFLDEKLLQILGHTDELKQVVLLTDGADTRAYRLTWPNSTLIFDISAEKIYSELSSKLRDVGAQITRNCLLIHVPKESPNVQEALRKKGFNGNRPSIWILQGLPLMTLANFENVLSTVGSLAMKGCLLIGEIPAELIEPSHEVEVGEWIHRIFMSHGFQVKVYDHEQIAKNLGAELLKEPPNSILFVAEHLRFSDDQMETWRWEFQRAEDEGDEQGFEDL
ncbi:O-methyltransferase 1, chloroplastic-like isoform X2 [Silene latifolia]|uniref:O-methyltransferase 1, chloroplastic-like isoform X2 n=1 Tax=Silene latifolia TaxID=37657 RepID=UPI003D778CC2